MQLKRDKLVAYFVVNIVICSVEYSFAQKGYPPTIVPFSAATNIELGSSVSFTCMISKGTNPVYFSWFKDGQSLNSDAKRRIFTSGTVSLLEIPASAVEDVGNYTCFAKNMYGSDSHSVSLDIKVAPIWKEGNFSFTGRIKHNITLTCSASGNPKPKIQFFRDDHILQSGGDYVVNEEDGNLIIKNVQMQNQGEYVCEASNGVGEKITKRLTLLLHGVAPSIVPFSFLENVQEGTFATVTCIISRGSPPLYFTWVKDGRNLATEGRIKVTSSNTVSTLEISAVAVEDVGNYTCYAKNLHGSDSHTVPLLIKVPPSWVNAETTFSAKMKQSITLKCPAKGHPAPTVSFTKDNQIVKSVAGQIEVSAGGELVIHGVNHHHQGDYQCTATNGFGEPIVKQIKLLLNVPAKFTERKEVVTSRRSEVTRLKCQAQGDQPLTITWYKANVRLDRRTSARYEIFETEVSGGNGLTSELVIKDTERGDGALYHCHTENKYGKDDRKIKVVVQEVPGPPQDVRVKDVWSRSVSVSWTSAFNGNSPISRYIVQYWRDHGTSHRLDELEVSGSQTSALVRELLPGTAYVLNVVAENGIGKGDASRTVNFHTGEEEPTSAPVDVNAEMKGPSTALISWKPPPREHWNGKLLGYYIGFRPRDTTLPYSYKRVEASSNSTNEFLLSGLARGTEYAIIIRAFNNAGLGPDTQERFVKTQDGDAPNAPRLFVTGIGLDYVSLRWTLRVGGEGITYNVNYRQDGSTWMEVPVPSSANNTFTLSNLNSGTIYQLYVTASNIQGRGDPSQTVTVQTLRSGLGESMVEIYESEDDLPLYMNMALVIPSCAVALAVVVIVSSACICCKHIRTLQVPMQEMMQYDPQVVNAMTTQRYVEMEKQQEPLPQPNAGSYGTVTMGKPNTGTWSRSDAVKNRPLPVPDESPLSAHFYDSAQ